MAPKIKELVIHRNRKYAWQYGNSVGYNIGLTVEDDESNLMEMKELLHKELTTLAITEEERCRDEAGASAELERIKNTEGENENLSYPTEKKKPLPKLPRNTPKIDTSRVYKISNTKCNVCSGLISWDLRPDRPTPLHVNKEGKQIGTGDCPEFGG